MPLSDQQKAAVAAYKAQKADRARNARLTKSNPVGPRPDEWTGHDKPREVRGGAPNPEATGPKVAWSAPQRGRWVQGPDKAEHFLPDESWERPVVETSEDRAQRATNTNPAVHTTRTETVILTGDIEIRTPAAL